jgi:hypothetical protein
MTKSSDAAFNCGYLSNQPLEPLTLAILIAPVMQVLYDGEKHCMKVDPWL